MQKSSLDIKKYDTMVMWCVFALGIMAGMLIMLIVILLYYNPKF